MSARAGKTGTKNYRFVGNHATEFEMESGARVQVGLGDFIDLTDTEISMNPEKSEWLLDVAATTPTNEEVEALKAEETPAATTPTEEGGATNAE